MSDQQPPPEQPWTAPSSGPPHGPPPGQPPYGGPPQQGAPPYGGPPQHWQPPFVRPEAPGATTAFVLGIIALVGGLLVCGVPLLLSPFAWYYGNQAMAEIERSGGALGGESQARGGQIMGMIGTGLLALGAVILVTVIAVSAGASSD